VTKKSPKRSRRQFLSAAGATVVSLSTLHAHLANIVVRTGQPLKFDANLETVFGSESAQKLLGCEYRKHWATPKQT